jgi:hypothetical protein
VAKLSISEVRAAQKGSGVRSRCVFLTLAVGTVVSNYQTMVYGYEYSLASRRFVPLQDHDYNDAE